MKAQRQITRNVEGGLAPVGTGDVGRRGVVFVLIDLAELPIFELYLDIHRLARMHVHEELLLDALFGHHARRQRARCPL